MKKIVIIGGLGAVGGILRKGLRYDLTIIDKKTMPGVYSLKVDATDFDALIKTIPRDTDVIINLICTSEHKGLVDIDTMGEMVDVYIKGVYNVYQAAVHLNIPKVILASSNHVTDYYEKDGLPTIGREITTDDYPLSNGLYGCLKLCGESIGFTFHKNTGLSVICLRIGSVRFDEAATLLQRERFRKTILSCKDLVDLIDKSIDADVGYGVYYGVSDNPRKPWSIDKAILELGYTPTQNSTEILRGVSQ